MRPQAPNCQIPSRPVSRKSFFGWIVVGPLQTTNVGRSIEFSSTCWLIKHGNEWLLWDAGVPEAAHNDPRGWSTLPKLIVYHLDRTLTDQLAEIGLKPSNITGVAISHTHGDHIGNVGLFPNSTIHMQQAEYSWIHSPNGP